MTTHATWVSETRYVFSVTIRLIHWSIFFAVVALSVTGYWIGSGNLPAGPGGVFQMGWIRYAHTVSGWVLFAALIARIFMFFYGTTYERLKAFFPCKTVQCRELWDVLLYYLFVKKRYPHMDYDHNKLAGPTYLVVYLLLLFMVFSGLALHGMAFPTGWQSRLTWPLALFSPQTLRLMHHMGMWLIWGFVAHHVASAILIDHETRGGLMGGIFSGWKSIPKRVK
jgi:Ni/Fe-hydrogenase 1 B-type cytochrome subunit